MIAVEMARNLPAGEAMDALIAEHIFGFWKAVNPQVPERGENWWGPHPLTPGVWCYASVLYGELRGGDYRGNSLPYYSTELRASWAVIQKLTAMPSPWLLQISNVVSAQRGVRWDVLIDLGAEADTLPLAICRAALLLPSEARRPSKESA